MCCTPHTHTVSATDIRYARAPSHVHNAGALRKSVLSYKTKCQHQDVCASPHRPMSNPCR